MLKLLRTKTRRVMLITLILIIPSFVLLYGWSSIQSRKSNAGLIRYSAPADYHYNIPGWRKWHDISRDDLIQARQQKFNN